MDVRTELSYPGARLADVYGLAVDAEFRAAVCVATGALDHDVDVRRSGDGSTVVAVRRTMAADVPDFVRRFVGDTIAIVQTESWAPADASRLRSADLSLQISGQPAAMSGALTLEELADGVRELVRGDLRVSIPFLGKKIEGEIARGILAAARKEEQVGRQWLAASPPHGS